MQTGEAERSKFLLTLARQEGFEPPTYCLEGSCSILLSYWRISFPRAIASHPKLKASEARSIWKGRRREQSAVFAALTQTAETERRELLPTLERVMGIEPTYPAWKAGVLPLNYTRTSSPFSLEKTPGCQQLSEKFFRFFAFQSAGIGISVRRVRRTCPRRSVTPLVGSQDTASTPPGSRRLRAVASPAADAR